MDSTIKKLPYLIPGPAGAASLMIHSQNPSQVSRSLNSYHFLKSQWHDLLSHLETPPYGETRLVSSIALLRCQALQQKFTRFPNVAVILTSLSRVGRDASVTLSDPSGSIRGTFHEEVFEKYQKRVGEGAALLLEDISAVVYMEKKPTGFRMQPDEGLHVSVQARNVKVVFPVPCRERVMDLSGFIPTESYEPKALRPPVMQIPLSRGVAQVQTALRRNREEGLPFKQRNKPRYKRPSLQQLKGKSVLVRHHLVRPAPAKPSNESHQSKRSKEEVGGFRCQDAKNESSVRGVGAALSDDELDVVLSTFDIDAAIKSRGKSERIGHGIGSRTELHSDLKFGSSSSMDDFTIESPQNKSDDSDFM